MRGRMRMRMRNRLARKAASGRESSLPTGAPRFGFPARTVVFSRAARLRGTSSHATNVGPPPPPVPRGGPRGGSTPNGPSPASRTSDATAFFSPTSPLPCPSPPREGTARAHEARRLPQPLLIPSPVAPLERRPVPPPPPPPPVAKAAGVPISRAPIPDESPPLPLAAATFRLARAPS